MTTETKETYEVREARLRIVPLKGDKIDQKALDLLSEKIIDIGEKFGLSIVVALN
jgi:hypothetical protein